MFTHCLAPQTQTKYFNQAHSALGTVFLQVSTPVHMWCTCAHAQPCRIRMCLLFVCVRARTLHDTFETGMLVFESRSSAEQLNSDMDNVSIGTRCFTAVSRVAGWSQWLKSMMPINYDFITDSLSCPTSPEDVAKYGNLGHDHPQPLQLASS